MPVMNETNEENLLRTQSTAAPAHDLILLNTPYQKPKYSLIAFQTPFAKPTIFCQSITKKPANGPANQAPTPFMNPQTAPQMVWKNFVFVATSTMTAIRATMPSTIHVTGLTARAAFHAHVTATTMPRAAASRPRPTASGVTHDEFFDNHPKVASMYGTAFASC